MIFNVKKTDLHQNQSVTVLDFHCHSRKHPTVSHNVRLNVRLFCGFPLTPTGFETNSRNSSFVKVGSENWRVKDVSWAKTKNIRGSFHFWVWLHIECSCSRRSSRNSEIPKTCNVQAFFATREGMYKIQKFLIGGGGFIWKFEIQNTLTGKSNNCYNHRRR